jgi:hypothetical protein
MHIVPVKLGKAALICHPGLGMFQYLRLEDIENNYEMLTNQIVSLLDSEKRSSFQVQT